MCKVDVKATQHEPKGPDEQQVPKSNPQREGEARTNIYRESWRLSQRKGNLTVPHHAVCCTPKHTYVLSTMNCIFSILVEVAWILWPRGLVHAISYRQLCTSEYMSAGSPGRGNLQNDLTKKEAAENGQPLSTDRKGQVVGKCLLGGQKA